jgi:hypothetical protein
LNRAALCVLLTLAFCGGCLGGFPVGPKSHCKHCSCGEAVEASGSEVYRPARLHPVPTRPVFSGDFSQF